MTKYILTDKEATEIWEDYIGDSGKPPEDFELTDFANAILGTYKERIFYEGAIAAYEQIINLSKWNWGVVELDHVREEIKLLTGKLAALG